MLNLYFKPPEINSYNRKYLVDVLKPLLPVKNLGKYGIYKEYLTIVNKPEESDFYILPFSWNYYSKFKKKTQAIDVIIESANLNKKIIIWVSGDYFIKLPKYDNILAMYNSLYQSMTHDNIISLPSIINDPLIFIKLDNLDLRSYADIPSVGFCGQVDRNFSFTFLKIIRNSWHFVLFYSGISNKYSGPNYPPTTFRKNFLDIIEESDLVNSNFIRRVSYKGGRINDFSHQKKVKKDYFQNICETDYTLCIRGTGNFSNRFYETLALGRIPVFINTDCILPFEDEINWKEHVVWVEENELSDIGIKISDFHNSLDKDTFHELQLKNRLLWEKFFSFWGFINKLVLHLNKKLNS